MPSHAQPRATVGEIESGSTDSPGATITRRFLESEFISSGLVNQFDLNPVAFCVAESVMAAACRGFVRRSNCGNIGEVASTRDEVGH